MNGKKRGIAWLFVLTGFFAFQSASALTPGERPCHFRGPRLMDWVSLNKEDMQSCPKQVFSFIAHDEIYQRQWRKAASNARAQKAVLRKASALFYEVGKNVKKTLIAASLLERSSRAYLNSKGDTGSRIATPFQEAIRHAFARNAEGPRHYDYVLAKNVGVLKKSLAEAGPKADLDLFDAGWKSRVDEALSRSNREYALVLKNFQRDEADKRKRILAARETIGRSARAFKKEIGAGAANIGAAEAPDENVRPAGSGQNGALMAAILGQKVVSEKAKDKTKPPASSLTPASQGHE